MKMTLSELRDYLDNILDCYPTMSDYAVDGFNMIIDEVEIEIALKMEETE